MLNRFCYYTALVLSLCPLTSYGQFVEFSESAGRMNISYSFSDGGDFGMGMTFFDFTGDGLDDIAFGGLPGESLHFYRSEGSTMTKLVIPGLVNHTSSKSLVWADYDNDGDPDLLVTHLGGRVRLFRNEGDLLFTDVSDAAGLDDLALYAYAACWFDYDRDGYLDFYVTNRDGFRPTRSDNQLYRNLGDGTFENTTVYANAADGQGLGFGVAALDYDRDGWPDLYIANDKAFTANTLLRNQGNGKFANVSDPLTTGIRMDGMGVGTGDFDGNGYEDLYITNTAQSSPDFGGNVFLKNHGNGSFTDVGDSLGMRGDATGWGANFADLDNDGWPDLFVANEGVSNVQRINRVYMNQGDGTFTEDVESDIYTTYRRSFGSAAGDLDNDGRVDLTVMNAGGDKVTVWMNESTPAHWLKVTLEGTVSNKDALGSWLELHAGGTVQYRYTRAGSGYGSQNSATVHFGLGETLRVDSIVVRWPGELVNTFRDLRVDTTYHFAEFEDTASQPQDTTVTATGNTGHEIRRFDLYPNPGRGQFRILAGNLSGPVSVRILQPGGLEVARHHFPSAERLAVETIDTRGLAPGLYIVELRSGKAIAFRRLVQY